MPVPPLSSREGWQGYRQQMRGTLRDLLGEAATLARQATAIRGATKTQDGVVVEYVAYPSEGPILVPAIVLRPQDAPAAKLPVIVMLGAGKRWRNWLVRLPLAISLASLAVIFSQPLGRMLQEKVTTDGHPGDLRVIEIMRYDQGNVTLHRVRTRG